MMGMRHMHNLNIFPNGFDRFLIALLLLLSAVPVAAQEQPMVITYGVSGGWFEPATNGQGLVFEVIPATNLMVAYWFTYPQDRPPGRISAPTASEPDSVSWCFRPEL